MTLSQFTGIEVEEKRCMFFRLVGVVFQLQEK